jgi:hypothetical protein
MIKKLNDRKKLNNILFKKKLNYYNNDKTNYVYAYVLRCHKVEDDLADVQIHIVVHHREEPQENYKVLSLDYHPHPLLKFHHHEPPLNFHHLDFQHKPPTRHLKSRLFVPTGYFRRMVGLVGVVSVGWCNVSNLD